MTDDLIKRLIVQYPDSALAREAEGRIAVLEAQVARMLALVEIRRVFMPFTSESTEQWREEHDACEWADAALADTAPQSSAVDDKIGPDAVAKAGQYTLSPRLQAIISAATRDGAEQSQAFQQQLRDYVRAIGEASHDC